MNDEQFINTLAEAAGKALRLAGLALAALALATVALIAGAVALTAGLIARIFAVIAALLRSAVPWARQIGDYIARGFAALIGLTGLLYATYTLWQAQGATWIALLLAATIILIPALFGLGIETSYGAALTIGLTAFAAATILTQLPTLTVPFAIAARAIPAIAIRPHLFNFPPTLSTPQAPPP